MEGVKRGLGVAWRAGLFPLITSLAFARSISLEGTGTALWIFIIIGVVIALVQLIPAVILFFSFIGTGTTMVFKGGKKVEEEVGLPDVEPTVTKRMSEY